MKVQEFYEKVKTDIDEAIRDMLDMQPKDIKERMAYALEGGKRLRPFLTVLVYYALGGKNYEEAISTAISIELAHGASLVHDDIIDRDKVRRGRLTLHELVNIPRAILLGHKLLRNGLKVAFDAGSRIVDIFLRMWNDAIAGELEDVKVLMKEVKELEVPAEALYFDIIKRKTASFFRGAAEIGAAKVGVHNRIVRRIGDYGEYVGIAYQLADDWVDMESGKLETLPLLMMAQAERRMRDELVEMCLKGRVDVYELLRKLKFDAHEFFLSHIVSYASKANVIIGELGLDNEYADMLREYPRWAVNKMLAKIGTSI